jgi:hypothetical protein
MSVRCKTAAAGEQLLRAIILGGLPLCADCGDLGDVVEAIVEAG